MFNRKTSPTRAKTGNSTTSSVPSRNDADTTASKLIEAPLKPEAGKLRRHDFPDGGGSGGAEAFRRKHH